MLTTPMVAWFQRLVASSSATETLKLARSRSFKLRTTWRLSFKDCAASMRSSRVRKAIIQCVRWPKVRLDERFGSYFFGDEGFDHVANFDVSVVGDRDTALHTVAYFAGVVFEALE